MTRKQVMQHPRQYCYFCGSEGPIETHHIVPRRHGGSNVEGNLVDVCPNCHQRLEQLYDSGFYEVLGIQETKESDEESDKGELYDEKRQMKHLINEAEEIYGDAPIHAVLRLYKKFHGSYHEADEVIQALRIAGEVYEPRKNILCTV